MKKTRVDCLTLGIADTNCYYLWREEEKGRTGGEGIPAIVIDPSDRGDYIYQVLEEKGLFVERILLTHGHFDHIRGVEVLKEKSGARVYCLEEERALCKDPDLNASKTFGLDISIEVDATFRAGDRIEAADLCLEVFHTPGHTYGSCCFYLREEGILFDGDLLFAGSVGRTDLPTGSMEMLFDSLERKIKPLPDEVILYSGHGRVTTVGRERASNPYMKRGGHT